MVFSICNCLIDRSKGTSDIRGSASSLYCFTNIQGAHLIDWALIFLLLWLIFLSEWDNLFSHWSSLKETVLITTFLGWYVAKQIQNYISIFPIHDPLRLTDQLFRNWEPPIKELLNRKLSLESWIENGDCSSVRSTS